MHAKENNGGESIGVSVHNIMPWYDGTIYTRDIEVLMCFWACQNILCTALNLANIFLLAIHSLTG